MRSLLCSLIVAISVSCVVSNECPTGGKVVFCYFASWSTYRLDLGTFRIQDIDPQLCTHMVYAFAGLDINMQTYVIDPWGDIDQGGFRNFVALKERNPCLKTMLGIGGWSQGSRRFSVMASTEEGRRTFLNNILMFLAIHEFDGLELDWEYPTRRGGIPEDRENFISLIKLLHESFEKFGLTLTISVPLSSAETESIFIMDEIEANVDYILIMAYDYTSITSATTGLLSPMSAIRNVVTLWKDIFVDDTKIVLGLPAYATTHRLLSASNNGIGAPTNGIGMSGTFTLEAGSISYYELMLELLSQRFTVVKVDDEQNYYAYGNTDWIAFEAQDTYKFKANYVIEEGLGGVMIWSIDKDDFHPLVNATRFPILAAVNDVFRQSYT